MAHYHASIHSTTTPGDAFAYLADFSNSEQWDPGVVRAETITPPPIGLGSEFHVVTGSAGRTVPFRYEIIEIEPSRRVVLRGTSSRLVSTDAIDVLPADDGGSTITYDADLRLNGVWRVFDIPLSLVFRRIGDRAVEGLRSSLDSLVERDV